MTKKLIFIAIFAFLAGRAFPGDTTLDMIGRMIYLIGFLQLAYFFDPNVKL